MPSRCFGSVRRAAFALGLGFCLLSSAGAAASPAAADGGDVGSVVSVAGDVRGTKPQRAPERLLAGDGLVLHHLIETGEESEAGMKLGADGTLSLGASTRISLDEEVIDQASRRPSRISLLVGYLRLRVGELFSGEIDIETPTATVGIKGTELEVEVDEAGRTTVRVLSGVVSLLSRSLGELIELGPGQSSVVDFGKAPSRPTSFEQSSPDGPGEPEAPEADSGEPEAQEGRTDSRGESRNESQNETQNETQPDSSAGDSSAGRVASCPARAQAGAPLCLCGSYPAGLGVGGAARIDGRPGGEVTSATPGLVAVRLPENLAPGRHRVSLPGQGGGCDVEVLGLETSYKEHLKQGRATYLLMDILGSREKLRLRVSSSNPRVVRIKGGNDQVVTTSGGRRNRARVRVKAVGDGQAGLDIAILDLPPCPCAATGRP